jgi:phosphoserine phosphatase RsbU/P
MQRCDDDAIGENMRKDRKTYFRQAIETIKESFRQVERKHWRGAVKDLREFYLTPEEQEKLKKKGFVIRWLLLAWWTLQSMIKRLSPIRGVFLVVGLVLLLGLIDVGGTGDKGDFTVPGGLIILFILMLELKDKIIAKDELKEGRAIQSMLMPPESPAFPGWSIWLYSSPANDVGGDLIDYLQLDKDRAMIALGDVAGKGLPAALMMARAQSTLHALAPEFLDIPTMVGRVNDVFCRDGIKSRFASLLYAVINAGNNKVSFVNAGHLPPAVVKKQSVKEARKGGIAIGLKPDTTYKQQELTLNAGELLVVYSDGLTEAQNEAGEFFGSERTLALFAQLYGMDAPTAGKAILAEYKKFVEDTPPSDDLSLMILGRK